MAIVEEPALTMKEAIMEVRADVKAILDILPNKADRTDLEKLTERVAALEKANAGESAVAMYRKWIIGLGAAAILTLLSVLANIALRIFRIGI